MLNLYLFTFLYSFKINCYVYIRKSGLPSLCIGAKNEGKGNVRVVGNIFLTFLNISVIFLDNLFDPFNYSASM